LAKLITRCNDDFNNRVPTEAEPLRTMIFFAANYSVLTRDGVNNAVR